METHLCVFSVAFLGGGVGGAACQVACRILALQPGIKHVPPAGEAQSLNHWTSREVPLCPFFVWRIALRALLINPC